MRDGLKTILQLKNHLADSMRERLILRHPYLVIECEPELCRLGGLGWGPMCVLRLIGGKKSVILTGTHAKCD